MLLELRRLTCADTAAAYVMKFSLDPADIGPKTLLMIAFSRRMSRGKLCFCRRSSRESDNPSHHAAVRHRFHFRPSGPFLKRQRVVCFGLLYQGRQRSANWDHSLYSQVAIDPPGVVGRTRPRPRGRATAFYRARCCESFAFCTPNWPAYGVAPIRSASILSLPDSEKYSKVSAAGKPERPLPRR